MSVEGVAYIHDLRVRTYGGLYLIEIHIVVDAALSVLERHRIAKHAEHCIAGDIGDVDRIIVHVDPGLQGEN